MNSCPVCHSNDLLLWGVKNTYKLYKCNDCTHLFADITSQLKEPLNNLSEDDFRSIITNSNMNEDYEYYRHLLKSEEGGSHTSITYQIINDFIKSLNVFETKTWLDVGCGSGHILDKMGKQGWNVIGVEPGEWGQIAAKERKLNIIKGFLTRDTFDQKFDVVSATDVLEHQSNPSEFIELLKYYLKSDGVLILSFPYADSLFAKLLKSRWPMIAPPTHCQFFNEKSIDLFASRHHLSIERKRQYNSTRFRIIGRFKWINLTIDRFFKFINWGDQVVLVLKPMKS